MPPGCFLDAPEMLKRQFTAFCMDTWCSTVVGGRIPSKVGVMLGAYRSGGFPKPFLDYQATNSEKLLAIFLGQFGEELSDDGRVRLTDFATGGALREGFEKCIFEVEEELRELRNARKRLADRKKKIEEDQATIDNAADQIKEIDGELKVLYRLLDDESEKYPLNLFVERGILPNYDLPESGVKLKAIITGIEVLDENGNATFEPLSKEYTRGASVAIYDFAPLNTFYVEARKILVDQVDTGGTQKSKITEWRLCPECSHLEVAALGDAREECPRCASPGYKDVGQRRSLLRLEKVSARVENNASKTLDDSDDREQTQYVLRDYIDVQPDSYGGAFVNEPSSFGFEYLRRVTLREVNFGPSSTLVGGKFRSAGHEIREFGFRVCRDCGVIYPSDAKEAPRHRYWCRFHSQPKADAFQSVFLYREVESEAIRFLLPLSTLKADAKSTSLKACLSLGLRLRFGGRPSHLQIKHQTVPEAGLGSGVRNYLVLYDTVPGGTGYLKEFVKDPVKLREVFEGALKALKSCACQRKAGADGCYRCVFAYQNQREMKLISRVLGIALVEEILAAWDGLIPTASLDVIRVSDTLLESELEERFVVVMAERAGQAGGGLTKVVSKGKPCYDLTLNGRVWRVEPQVVLDSNFGINPSSRADFVLWPSEESPEAIPVALFTDGYRYHVCPDQAESRIADDVDKRFAVARSGQFAIWTLTWHDLDKDDDGSPQTLKGWGTTPSDLSKLAVPFKLGDFGWSFERPLTQLLAYLSTPHRPLQCLTIDAAAFAAVSKCPVEAGEPRRICRDTALGTDSIEPVVRTAESRSFGKLVNGEDLRLALGVAVPERQPEAFFGAWLNDDHDARRRDAYLQSWRDYWAAFNLMARPDRFFVGPTLTIDYSEPVVAPSEPAANDSASGLTGDWGSVADLVAADLRDFVYQLSLADLSVPEVGFELCTTDGYVIAEAELAWPDKSVALLTAGQMESSESFVAAGWVVFSGDASTEEIIEKVKE